MSQSDSSNRRAFLQNSAGSAAAFAGGLSFLSQLPRVSAAEAVVRPEMVGFAADIEPLVRLIEESPRERVLERVADRVRGGRSYSEVLAALLLAGVRNVQPYPSVGFKFHCVLVVNSCHLASLSGPDEDRWLPIFWALDYFKSSQADEAQRSGWHLRPVNESLVPDADAAARQFADAMDRWDVEKADAATAGLVRSAGATAVFNQMAQYAARDFRSIGHKAIYLANAWRTLQVIGWQFAEPVMRSLTFAMLNHTGQRNPADNDFAADRPWRDNRELASRLPENWLDGALDDATAEDLIVQFRSSDPREAAEAATDALSHGVAPQSVWDSVFVGAGELLMRQPAIVPLHALTTANAVRFLWRNVADDQLRRRLLLQACSFNCMFRDAAQRRGSLNDLRIDALENEPSPTADAPAPPEIIADISSDKLRAAGKVVAYLSSGGDGQTLIDAARRQVFLKGRDAHDYKFSSAVLEDYGHVSANWRNRFLAASVFKLKGSGGRDSALVERTRAALG